MGHTKLDFVMNSTYYKSHFVYDSWMCNICIETSLPFIAKIISTMLKDFYIGSWIMQIVFNLFCPKGGNFFGENWLLLNWLTTNPKVWRGSFRTHPIVLWCKKLCMSQHWIFETTTTLPLVPNLYYYQNLINSLRSKLERKPLVCIRCKQVLG
jgi:hypothetical protein